MSSPDWTLLQSFVAIGETGSFSAAAKARAISQPTMSRHISLLEQSLGVRLVERSKSGAALTRAGTDLYDHARTMADAASHIPALSQGAQSSIGGTVRITASEIMAAYVLPDILTRLAREEPDITIELVASDESKNLLRREADIALRMYRPTQLDVVTRHVGDAPLGAYASKKYVAARGAPQSVEAIRGHTVIGYDRSTLIIDGFRDAGFPVDRDFFQLRCDNQIVCWQMVLAGYGIGFNQRRIGDRDPDVVRLEAFGDVGTIPLWLTAHNELNTTARIRRVYDFLVSALGDFGGGKDAI